MYDLETLRILNEQAHLRALALANDRQPPPAQVVETTVDNKPAPVFPLSVLARKLLGGPPSISYFMALLEQGEVFAGFHQLVREFLPESEANIMTEDIDRRASKFGQLFSQKFFPLSDDAVCDGYEMGDLLSSIPYQPLGFSYESYHDFSSFRQGYILALALVEAPWEEDPLGLEQEEEEDEGIPGARLPILEAAGDMVGEGLIRLIPGKGWSAEELHALTDDTEFNGLGLFADWVFGNTGSIHLDTQGAALEMGTPIEWTGENVRALTEDWHRARDIFDQIHRVVTLLEQEPEETFRRLVALLLHNSDLIIPREQLPLPL